MSDVFDANDLREEDWHPPVKYKPMTVAALIKDLQALPQDANVFRFIPGEEGRANYKPFTRACIQFDGPNVIVF